MCCLVLLALQQRLHKQQAVPPLNKNQSNPLTNNPHSIETTPNSSIRVSLAIMLAQQQRGLRLQGARTANGAGERGLGGGCSMNGSGARAVACLLHTGPRRPPCVCANEC